MNEENKLNISNNNPENRYLMNCSIIIKTCRINVWTEIIIKYTIMLK